MVRQALHCTVLHHTGLWPILALQPLPPPTCTKEKVRIAAPKGWEIELMDFSLGVHGPTMSNYQVGARC